MRSGRSPRVPRPRPIDTALELASFDSAWRRIRDTYYDSTMHGLDWNRVRDEIRPQVARARTREESRAAMGRMLATLGDSHFGIVAGEPSSDEGQAAADAPGDLGFEVRYIGDELVVSGVDSTGPAARAGVSPGWTVVALDTLDAAARSSSAAGASPNAKVAALRRLLNAVRMLHGAPGSGVHLTFRDGAGILVERDLVRRDAPGTVVRLGQLPPVPTWFDRRRIDERGGCVGVIRFNVWMTAIAQPFDDAMNEFRQCDGIVLDLRGNVGGVAAMVIGITGHFVDHELLLGELHMRSATLRYVANPRRVTRDGTPVTPYAGSLAVLVDELSASTTEIFVAALQKYGRARIFGDTTAGEALPSLITRLPNGDALQYAVADFVDPSGRRLEGKGIVPDELVPLRRNALLAGRDETLAAALHWLGLERRRHTARGNLR